MTLRYSTLITSSQLKKRVNHPNVRLLDCRFNLMDENKGLESFNQGHIVNSQYADLNKQLAGPILKNTGRHPLPDKRTFEKQLQHWGIDESCQVVVYDDMSGAIAARLWWMCKWAGLEHAALLDGGLKHWMASGNQLSKERVSFNQSAYQAQYNDALWVHTGIIEKIDPLTVSLTDARAEDRFEGKVEPIDPLAGHIPGAVNMPFENNLNTGGTFLSKKKLAKLHQQAAENTKVISMCGSGVTACHNILARAHAGLDTGQLYVGSWSEWITDPEHDIASTSDAQTLNNSD